MRQPMYYEPDAPSTTLVDEADAGQILTVEELRALRDRMGAEAAAARQGRSAAQREVPASPAVIPLEAHAEEVREVLRHLVIRRQRWSRRLVAVGCLALAGGAVSVLVITASTRSEPGSAGQVVVPVFPAPVVSVPVPVPPVTASSAPEPVSPPVAPVAPVAPVVPIAPAPGGSAAKTTKLPATKVPAARVHPPRARSRPAPSRPPVAPAASDGRPPPTVVDLDERRRGQR